MMVENLSPQIIKYLAPSKSEKSPSEKRDVINTTIKIDYDKRYDTHTTQHYNYCSINNDDAH